MPTFNVRWHESADRVTNRADIGDEGSNASPSAPAVSPATLRAMRAADVVRLPEGRDEVVPGREGPIPVRVFEPAFPQGVFLHFHPGGWMFGGADHQDDMLWALAQRAHVAVVSVGYRLAPEHPHPAAANDAEDAARWILASSVDRFGVDRVLIGGESTGAHLAVLALLRTGGGAQEAFVGASLAFGCFDLSLTPSARVSHPGELITESMMRWMVESFVGPRDDHELRSPDVSPLYATLPTLPPAIFMVGTEDPLLDDSLLMAARWRAAGSDTELCIFEGAGHGFTNELTGAGLDALDLRAHHARRCIDSAQETA